MNISILFLMSNVIMDIGSKKKRPPAGAAFLVAIITMLYHLQSQFLHVFPKRRI